MTCGVTPNALWHRCSHVESRRAKCSNAPAVRAESGLGETTTWSAPYANWYANQPDSGGVRGCTPTYVKRSDLQELDTHEHRRTHCLNLGVKWSGSNPVSPTAEMSSELREWTCRPPSPAVCGRQPRSAAHEQYMSSYPLMPERPSALGGYRGSQRRRSDPCSGRGNRHNKRGQPLRGAVRRGPNSSVTRTVATYLVPSA